MRAGDASRSNSVTPLSAHVALSRKAHTVERAVSFISVYQLPMRAANWTRNSPPRKLTACRALLHYARVAMRGVSGPP